MLTKYIPQNIQEKLKAKERALERAKKPDSPLDKGYMSFKSMASRTIFVRMCSNKSDVPNILISGGEVGPDGEVQFGGNAYKDYSGGDKVRPIAGIKDIQVEYKGGYKALREATINWTCWSFDEVERLTPHFLSVGKTVLLEWGWSPYIDNTGKYTTTLDFTDIINTEWTKENLFKRQYARATDGHYIDEKGNKYIRVKGVRWFTNLDYTERHEDLILYKNYKGNEKED